MRTRLATALATATVTAAAVGLLVGLPANASAPACSAAWKADAVYTGGMSASLNGRNYLAKWWTQNENPVVNGSGVWTDQGSCGGSGGSGGSNPTTGGGSGSGGSSGTCTAAAWVAGRSYVTGDVVRYTDGKLYVAEHDNPGYDPTISTWFWDPHTCTGAGGPATTSAQPTSGGGSGTSGGFVVSSAQFEQMFPGRNSFYTYAGLVAALKAYPAFGTTGSDTVRKQEAAAFLANISHETGGLVYVVEQNTANYPHYCDASQSYGCPAGQSAYYGRGPIQLSWNFNYKAAGDALGIDLLHQPNLVQTDAEVAWKTGIWYWMTSTGAGSMTAHQAMVGGSGFGETIRTINGSLECGGRNPAQVSSRAAAYQRFAALLGVPTGANLTC